MDNNSSDNSEDEEVQYVITDKEDSADDECIYCQEPYRNDKRYIIKCIKCARWSHFAQELSVGRHIHVSFVKNNWF